MKKRQQPKRSYRQNGKHIEVYKKISTNCKAIY